MKYAPCSAFAGISSETRVGAKDDTPEITTMKFHWKVLLKIHWTIPLESSTGKVTTLGKFPEGTKCATSVNVQLPCLRKDLRTGSISRDIVNFPSELCRRRSGIFTEVARLVPPGTITRTLAGYRPETMRLP